MKKRKHLKKKSHKRNNAKKRSRKRERKHYLQKRIHRNKHHTFPRSRFTLNKNIKVHNAWHKLFVNMSTEEAKLQLEKWSNKSGEISDKIRNTTEWKSVFGKIKNLNEAKIYIDIFWRTSGIIGVLIPQEKEGENFAVHVIYYNADTIVIKLLKVDRTKIKK